MSQPNSFYTLTPDGAIVAVKVKPNVSKAREMRVVDVGDGKRALEVSVAAPPEGGRANRAVCEALADALGVPRAAIGIKAGQSGRLKLVEVRFEGVEQVLETLFPT